jgi:hypothetical protein
MVCTTEQVTMAAGCNESGPAVSESDRVLARKATSGGVDGKTRRGGEDEALGRLAFQQ